MHSTGYMMDAAAEGERLERKTDHELTRLQLNMTGIAAGMRALDVGAGTGAVARDMASIVGPRGSVVAFDGSAERLAQGKQLATRDGVANLDFLQGNVYDLSANAKDFDYVWARFFFEYLDRPIDALNQMVSALKPGGRIVLCDIDGNCNLHYPMPRELAEGIAVLESSLAKHFDPSMGRKLFHMMVTHPDLEDVRLDVRPYHLIAGKISAEQHEHWKMKLQNFRSAGAKTLGAAHFDAFERAFLAHLNDPTTLTYSVLFTVWANKRGA